MTTPFSSKITTFSAEMENTTIPEVNTSAPVPVRSPTHRPSRKSSLHEEPPVLELASDLAAPKPDLAAPKPEPLLSDAEERLVLFPIRHADLWQRCKQQQSVIWLAEEIDLSKDMKDWEKLNSAEQDFIKNILGFFAASDGIVMENLATRFSREVMWPEARYFYANQTYMEAVHCVAPETKILTDTGYHPISNLENQLVNVWNGEEFTEVKVVNTSSNAKLIKVILSNGMFLECTEEHKWFTRTGPIEHPERCEIVKTFTKDLKVGDIIGKYTLPVITLEDPDEFLNPYTHGFFCGDGTYTNKYPLVSLYGDKQALLPYLEVSSINPQPQYNRTTCYLTNKINKNKFFVPINYSQKTKLLWLAGLLDADGCVKTSNKGLTAIQMGSINTEFLHDVQLLLSTLGIRANFTKNKDAERRFMPDGKGGMKEYECLAIYCLYISLANVHKLVTLGFTPHRLALVTKEVKENAILLRVEQILDEGRMSPTFCFTEPKKHAGIFNGILTGQSETYSLLIDYYVTDKEEKHKILHAAQTIPCIQKKAEWALSWIDSKDADFATRLIGFAAVEGIFFSGAFCAIFWMKERGLLPGLTTSNEFIARDEGLHMEFACLLYSKVVNRLSKQKVHTLIREAVKIEKKFITKSLPCELIGMNAKLMAQYIEFVADRLCLMLGYPKIWCSTNPFGFMERISLENKDNFFEKRVSTYAKAASGKKKEDMAFKMNADF